MAPRIMVARANIRYDPHVGSPNSSIRWVCTCLKIWDNLKNDETIDIWNELGDFQLGTGSTDFHFLSSINEKNDSLSLVPLYCLNWPSFTLKW